MKKEEEKKKKKKKKVLRPSCPLPEFKKTVRRKWCF